MLRFTRRFARWPGDHLSRAIVATALCCAGCQAPAHEPAPAKVEMDVKQLQEYAVYDLESIARTLNTHNTQLGAIEWHPLMKVGKEALTDRPEKRQQLCPDGEYCLSDKIPFKIHLLERGRLANRITRLTVIWDAMKANCGSHRTWTEQAIGIKIDGHLKALDVVRASQPTSTGRLLTWDIAPGAFSPTGDVAVAIERNERFAGCGQNDAISVDAVRLEMRP